MSFFRQSTVLAAIVALLSATNLCVIEAFAFDVPTELHQDSASSHEYAHGDSHSHSHSHGDSHEHSHGSSGKEKKGQSECCVSSYVILLASPLVGKIEQQKIEQQWSSLDGSSLDAFAKLPAFFLALPALFATDSRVLPGFDPPSVLQNFHIISLSIASNAPPFLLV